MAQTQDGKSDGKTHGMETRRRIAPAILLSPQTSTEAAYGDCKSPSVEATASQYLHDFAATKGMNLHTLKQMGRTQLAEFLKAFYRDLKSRQEDMAALAISLTDLREGLHRLFLREKAVDILRDNAFDMANATFDTTVRYTGTTGSRKCHRMKIEVDDLRRIYMGEAMDLNKPDSLQNKVFFDINLYICNRSKDHLRIMKKDDFEVVCDPTGKRIVWLKEHPKFSSGTDKEFDGYQDSDRMMERPGDPKCPVRSFLKYLEHLHPMTDAFWQRPKRNVSQSDYVWYDHSPIGTSTLNRIMQRTCIMAGMYESYTNHSIRAAYIPMVEHMCSEALASNECHQMSLMSSEAMGSPIPRGTLTSGSSLLQSQDSVASKADSSGDESSLASELKDSEDGDVADAKSLREAKMKVLEQIQTLMVRDIPKFVDWLKTVRVEYHGDRGNQMRVLCNPVDKHNVDLAAIERPQRPPTLRQQSRSLDLGVSGRPCTDSPELQGIAIKQVEFQTFSNTYCSLEELAPIKITIPREDTLLVTGVPENVQLMLHKRQGDACATKEILADRIFCSENEMDVAEVAAHLGTFRSQKQGNQLQQPPPPPPQQFRQDITVPVVMPAGMLQVQLPVPIPAIEAPRPQATTVPNHLTGPFQHRPVQQQNSFENKSKSELIKTKKYKSVTYRELSPIPDLKRVSSTGTPTLKRQANVVESHFGDEPMSKRGHSEDLGILYPHLSREDSLEALRLRADRLDDSLRMHQEILQNSPLLKKQMDRHGTGFRHSYNPVKSEPKDT